MMVLVWVLALYASLVYSKETYGPWKTVQKGDTIMVDLVGKTFQVKIEDSMVKKILEIRFVDVAGDKIGGMGIRNLRLEIYTGCVGEPEISGRITSGGVWTFEMRADGIKGTFEDEQKFDYVYNGGNEHVCQPGNGIFGMGFTDTDTLSKEYRIKGK